MAPYDLKGIIPPTTTPFDAREELDLGAFRAQLQFLEAAGVQGVCVGGSTGEGHTLETRELASLWTAAAAALGGRLPLVAGVIVDSTRQAVERCAIARDCGAMALQVTPPHYLFRPDDDAMVQHFRDIAEASGLPVLIYNVVPWCYLSPALLIRTLREVPGVVGVKQSNGDLKLLADLLLDLPEGKIVYSAVDALIYPSLLLGAHGVIAALPAAIPAACVALWNAVQRRDLQTAETLHGRILRVWNAMAGDNLPAGAKYVQSLQGVPAGVSRKPMRMPSVEQQARLRAAWEALQSVV